MEHALQILGSLFGQMAVQMAQVQAQLSTTAAELAEAKKRIAGLEAAAAPAPETSP